MKVPPRGNERFGARSRFPHWDTRTLYPGLVSRVPSRAVAGIPGMLVGFASNVAVVNMVTGFGTGYLASMVNRP